MPHRSQGSTRKRAGAAARRAGVVLAAALVGLVSIARAQSQWIPNGTPICTEPGLQFSNTLISDQNGGAILIWQDARNGNNDIYAQRIDALGVPQWEPGGVVVCSHASDQAAPIATSDGANGALVLWMDLRSGNYDIYGQRINSAGVRQWAADGVPVCTAAGSQGSIASVQDLFTVLITLPGAIVSWQDPRSGVNGSDVYVQHVDSNGGGGWLPATGVPLCTATGHQTEPVIATDGAGLSIAQKGAIVAWTDARLAGNNDIYARRVDAGGNVLWTNNGVGVCTAAGNQEHPSIAYVGGGVAIAWQDNRDPLDGNVYVQKIDINGSGLWTGNGVLLCNDDQAQSHPVLAADGAGGAIVAWRDARTGTLDIYLQNVDANGALLWAEDGIPVTATNGGKVFPSIISASNGGAILAWEDYRNGHRDIYAQRVDADGNRLWGDDGVRVCGAANDQYNPRVTFSDADHAIVAWGDNRSDDADLYANRVLDPHSVDVRDRNEPGLLRIELRSPNPARGDVMLEMSLPEASVLTAEVVDARGRLVRRLASGTWIPAGRHVLRWDGRNESGGAVASGVYFLRARSGERARTIKMVQVR